MKVTFKDILLAKVSSLLSVCIVYVFFSIVYQVAIPCRLFFEDTYFKQ